MYYRINRKWTHTESTYANVQTGQEAGLFDAVIRVRHGFGIHSVTEDKGGVQRCRIAAASCEQMKNLQLKGGK